MTTAQEIKSNVQLNFVFLIALVFMSLIPIAAIADSNEIAQSRKDKNDETVADKLPDINQDSTLDDYIAYALLNNAELKAVFENYKAELQKISQVKTLPDPRFNYSGFIREVETRVGPQQHKFGISQTFPWFGKLSLKGKMANESAKAALHLFENKKLEISNKVKQVYFDFYFLGRSILIVKENIALVRNLELVARSRYRSGIGNYSDLIRTEVEVEKLKDQLNSLKDLGKPLLARFNQVLNRPFDSILFWPKAIPYLAPKIDSSELLAMYRHTNPVLKSLDRQIFKEDRAISLAKRSGLPDFTLGFDYILTGDASTPVPDNGKDPIAAKISINLPIWRGKYSAEKREAVARKHKAEQLKHEKTNALASELKIELYKFEDAGRKMGLYRDRLIPKAKQSFEATRAAYEAGNSSFSDLIDSERLFLEFKLVYEQSLTNVNKAMANLEMLVGGKLPIKNEEKLQKENAVKSSPNPQEIKESNALK